MCYAAPPPDVLEFLCVHEVNEVDLSVEITIDLGALDLLFIEEEISTIRRFDECKLIVSFLLSCRVFQVIFNGLVRFL